MSKVSIADFIDKIGDGIHGTPCYSENGSYYFVNGNNLKDGHIIVDSSTLKIEQNEYEKIKRPLNENTILISINGTIGNLAFYNGEKIALGKSACYLNVKSTESKHYIRYVLSTQEFKKYALQVAHGSTIKNLAPGQIAEYTFFAPDSASRTNIAYVLKVLDDKIENNKKICSELESMTKNLYDYWFVQFDFPDENGKSYRTSGGEMVWNDQLKREIPKGWEVGNLYSIADFINGLACQKFRPKDGEKAIPVIKIKEMHDGITAETEQVSENIPSKHKISDGDILFSWSATLEVMYWYGGSGGLNQHIFKVNPKSYFPKEYVYEQLSSYIVNFVKMAEARKTTMGHITTDHLEQSKIPLPPESLMKQFKEKVYPIHLKIGQTKQENRELTKLCDWLLPMLMNGQARVE